MSVEQQKLYDQASAILRKNKPGKKTLAKRRREKRKQTFADMHRAMRLFLGLGLAEPIDEHALRECERKLNLPKIRLYLDRDTQFSSVKGRRWRIFKALQQSHPSITRHCVMRTR